MRERLSLEENFRWFWELVRASGLCHLLYTGYKSAAHDMIRALYER